MENQPNQQLDQPNLRPGITKISVNLPSSDVETLKKLAEERRTTMTEVLKSAIRSERYLWDRFREGAKFLIEVKGVLREVLFFK